MVQVLADEEYARRKEFYLESGQRHYYFMTIGNGETIDACRKVTLMLLHLRVVSHLALLRTCHL